MPPDERRGRTLSCGARGPCTDPIKPRLTKDRVRHIGFDIPIDDRDRRQIVRSMGTHQHPKPPGDGEGRPEHETCDYGLFRASDPLR